MYNEFLIEILLTLIIDSCVIVRNTTARSHVASPQFPPMVTFCSTTVNIISHIDIGNIHGSYTDFPHFTCTHLYMRS